MINLIIIGVGGFLGAIFRYYLSGLVQEWGMTKFMTFFPIGTMVVNVLGCLLIGFFQALFLDRQLDQYRLLVNIGFIGGFTTFSTFSLESLKLIEEMKYLQGFLNIFLSCLIGLIAVWLGQLLYKLIWEIR